LLWPAHALENICIGKAKLKASSGIPLQAGVPQPGALSGGKGFIQSPLIVTDREVELRHFAAARAQFQEFVERYPQCAQARWNLAVIEAYQNAPQALDQVQRWLAASPSTENGKRLASLMSICAGNPPRTVLAGPKALPASAQSAFTPPSHRTLIWLRAVNHQAMGDLREARSMILELLPTNLDTPEIWYALGNVALDDARSASRCLSETAPHSDWSRKLESQALSSRYPNLAQEIWPTRLPRSGTHAAVESGRPNPTQNFSPEQAFIEARAIAATLDSLESGGKQPSVLYARAQKSLELASLAYGQAARAPGFEAQIEALRALAAEQENDEKQAIEIYREGLKQHPESAALHAGLGEVYRHRLELTKARQELEIARRLDPTDSLLAYELGDVFERLNEPRQAIPVLSQALKLNPGLLLARWSRAKAYLALGDLQRAAQDFQVAAPIDPSGEVERQLARVYARLGQPALAHQAERKAEALEAKHASPKTK
jgi:tetratricopeptide (TPR) repeat protein